MTITSTGCISLVSHFLQRGTLFDLPMPCTGSSTRNYFCRINDKVHKTIDDDFTEALVVPQFERGSISVLFKPGIKLISSYLSI